MRGTMKILTVVVLAAYAFSCVKPFNPPVVTSANLNYLVVDGFIVPGSSTTIKLSRTLNISDSFRFIPELNAQLYIEGLSGSSYSFQTGIDGVYTSPSAFLSNDDKYRLRILLSDGKEYVSDYVEVKQSPPIDSLTWEEKEDISIYANTHDPTGKARYYKWEFVETVEYRAIYESFLEYRDHQIIFLEPDQYRYQCFKFYNSTDISIATSSALSDDIIRRARITIIPNDYSKIAHRYSILVKQYSLTAEAYKYWHVLQANTEQNGNIFDPQPAQLRSNIHNVADPNEPVIGFVSVSNYSEKRMFIRGTQLNHRPPVPYSDICEVDYPSPADWDMLMANGLFLPAYFSTGRGLAIAPAECVDCRLQGGTTEKPPYW
jgi:uncharacterized protein DUF4249